MDFCKMFTESFSSHESQDYLSHDYRFNEMLGNNETVNEYV